VLVGRVAVVGLSPICGIYAMSAQWSLWLVVMVVIVVSACVASVGGRRMSQWSSGVFDGR